MAPSTPWRSGRSAAGALTAMGQGLGLKTGLRWFDAIEKPWKHLQKQRDFMRFAEFRGPKC